MWHLRPATADDLEFLFQVHREALGPYIEHVWGWDETEQRANFEATFPSGHWSVIFCGPIPIGGIRVSESDDAFYLDDIEILPPFQGKGIGTSVVEELLERADAAGKPVALQVMKANPARRLYERLGFECIGENDVHVRMRRGTKVSAALIRA